jgi:NADH:ubiquinone oxidoreductase subunit 6 (subunit J)
MEFAFTLLAVLVLAGAVWVVTLRNLFRAALSLGLVLLGVAGLFVLLEAEFLAFAQILVYVGAVLTLIIFAVMLTVKLQGSSASPASRQTVPAAAVSVGLFAVLVSATQPLVWPSAPADAAVPLAELGQQLVTTLVLPFEVVSIVFVAAAVGSIALASSGKAESRPRG